MSKFRDYVNDGDAIVEAKKEEFVIWGVPEGQKDEVVVYTKAKTEGEAKKVMKILKDKHNVTKVRLQIIDFSTEIDFVGAIK